jgi:DNA polymerase I-like protein with 3'-5' exonuclease and polymerase domains/uracil-DNA glycosylase
MGFFLEDSDVKLITSKPMRAPRAANKPATAVPGCDGCVLKQCWPRMVSPKMSAFVQADADILVLGTCPYSEADRSGMPFSKEQMRLLRRAVPARHWERLAFQNVIRCNAYIGSIQGFKAAASSCSIHLQEDLAQRDYKAIIGFGDVVLRQLIPDFHNKDTSRDITGTWLPIEINGKPIWYYNVFGFDLLSEFGDDEGSAWPVFRADVEAFFKRVDKIKPPVVHHELRTQKVQIVHTLAEAQAVREKMGKIFAWDCETHSTRKGAVPQPTDKNALMLSAAFSDDNITFAFSVEHPLERNAWAKPFIKETLDGAVYWIAHQSGYESVWSAERCGVFIDPSRFHDTMAAARCKRNSERGLSLATQSSIHLGINVKFLSDLNVRNLIAYPLEDVLYYNGLDSYATKHVWNKNEDIIDDRGYQRYIASIAMVSQMQLYGLPVDLGKSYELQSKWKSVADDYERQAKRLYEVKQWELTTGNEWSISSDQDTAAALVKFGRTDLPKTAVGNYETAEPVLLRVAPDNPLVKAVLGWREANKIKSTYVDPLIEHCTNVHKDGLLHPCYTVLKTNTARLSSEDPNSQNFPRRSNPEVREQIVAYTPEYLEYLVKEMGLAPGTKLVLVAFDYGQLEARLIAMVSKDPYFCEAILKGYDIHGVWGPMLAKIYPDFWKRALNIFGDDEKKILKWMRDLIKNKFVFPSFYLANAGAIAGYLEVEPWAIEQLHVDFWKKFAGVREWQKARKREYKDTGSAHTLTKRYRHAIMTSNDIVNMPIQSLGADVVADAMCECARISRKEKDIFMHPRIQIHDDLTFILRDDQYLEDYVDRIFSILAFETMPRYEWQTLPFLVEAKAAFDWRHLDEFATFTGGYVQ